MARGLYSLLLLVAAVGIFSRPPASPHPAEASSPSANSNVVVANVTDQSMVVTWTSDQPSVGQVRLTSGETIGESEYPNGRGAIFRGRTHYVLVTGLPSSRPITFDLLSGNEVDDNRGAHYAAQTGPALPAQTGSDLLTGVIKNSDGSLASDAFVLARLEDADNKPTLGRSQWLAVPAPDDPQYFGQWILSIRMARTGDLSTYFAYSSTGDNVRLQAYGAGGVWSETVDVSAPRFGKNFQITLEGSLPTATPAPPTLTPVPTTPVTMTATATWTPGGTVTATRTVTVTGSPTTTTATPSRTLTATLSPTRTPSPSSTPTASATATATATPTPSNTPTVTATPVVPSSVPPSPTEALTETPMPIETPGPTETARPTETDTPLPTRARPDAARTPTPASVSQELSGTLFPVLLAAAAFSVAALLLLGTLIVWRRGRTR